MDALNDKGTRKFKLNTGVLKFTTFLTKCMSNYTRTIFDDL